MARNASPIPDFFIVGAPKCGTTAMAHYLSLHPEIFLPFRKELHFFGSDLTRIPHEFFVLDEGRYRRLFARARAKRIGEASVMYLYSKRAAREIKAFNPEARILIMLRNPVDMLYAYHSQLYWGTYEDIADFGQALAAEPERRQGRRVPRCAMMPEALYYRDVASFAEQVERYLDTFAPERVHVILFDDFAGDLPATYRRTLEFLEVSPHDLGSFKVVNPNKVLRSRRLMEAVQRPPRALRLALDLVPDLPRQWLLAKLQRANTRYVRRPPMDPALRGRLVEEFAGEVERLGRILGRDLGAWSKD